MRLQAIIGRGTSCEDSYAFGDLIKSLFDRGYDRTTMTADPTDEIKIDAAQKCERYAGKNLYLDLKITDPQEFYQFLSAKGFVLGDTKITFGEVVMKDGEKLRAELRRLYGGRLRVQIHPAEQQIPGARK